MFETMTPANLIISAETNKGLLNTQTSAVQISFE